MKKVIRFIIEKFGFKKELDYISTLGIGTIFVNFMFQRIFRIDSNFAYMKHFTSRVVNGQNIKIIGENEEKLKMVKLSFIISGGCFFNGANGIEIGEGTIFSQNVVISSIGHDFSDISKGTVNSPIKIGKDVWIGANVVIMPEVIIADGSVIGAGSIVTKSFLEPNKVIAGVPAKIIKDKFN